MYKVGRYETAFEMATQNIPWIKNDLDPSIILRSDDHFCRQKRELRGKHVFSVTLVLIGMFYTTRMPHLPGPFIVNVMALVPIYVSRR